MNECDLYFSEYVISPLAFWHMNTAMGLHETNRTENIVMFDGVISHVIGIWLGLTNHGIIKYRYTTCFSIPAVIYNFVTDLMFYS